MKRGPQPTSRPRTPIVAPLEKARAAWGAELPPEIEALARACAAETASAVAIKLGYSGGLVSHVLARRYPGNVALVFAKIRGTLMGEVVECPIVGIIPSTRCLDEQKRPFHSTNSIRARLFHACKTCPNNRKNQEPDHV